MLRSFIIAACAMFALAGCSRISDAQAVQLSQAKADATAAHMTNDAAARSALFEACGMRLMAGLNDLELPPPITPAASFVAADGAPIAPAIEQEMSAAKAAQEDPPSGMLGMILGGIGGVGLFALGILRTSPGAFGLVANLAHSILAPKATRDMRAVQAKATEVAQQAVTYGHAVASMAEANGLKADVEKIKDKAQQINRKLGIEEPIRALLASVKDPSHSTPTNQG